jgi:hypothetical protein
MAESGLSIGYPELIGEVGKFLRVGYKAYDDYSAAQKVLLNNIVQSGVRRVYYPPATIAGSAAYEWSWLRPTSTLDTEGAYSTGTVTIVDGVVTLADGTFPAWAEGATLLVDNESYTVDSRDGDDQITLEDLTVDADAGTTYSLVHSYIYDLPDDFGRIFDSLHYAANLHRASIDIISVSQLLGKRSEWDLTGYPEHAAIRYKASDRTDGQRQEVLFYPTPDVDLTLYYEYEAYSGVLSTTYPYPLGGMQLAELYLESCLAVAESRVNQEMGIHNQQFQMLLIDAIQRDMKRGAKNFGKMGQPDTERMAFKRGYDSSYFITYKGERI